MSVEAEWMYCDKRGRLRLQVSPDRAEGSMLIHQDARVYAGLFDGAENAELIVPTGRQVYVHLARGTLTVNGMLLNAGDAIAMTTVDAVTLREGQGAEVLVFDLPAGGMTR